MGGPLSPAYTQAVEVPRSKLCFYILLEPHISSAYYFHVVSVSVDHDRVTEPQKRASNQNNRLT